MEQFVYWLKSTKKLVQDNVYFDNRGWVKQRKQRPRVNDWMMKLQRKWEQIKSFFSKWVSETFA